MAGTFEAFGNEVRSTMAGFAESVSGEIISSISPIIYTGIMIYFFCPGLSNHDRPGGRRDTRLDHTMRKDCIGRFFRTECRKFRNLCYPGGLWHRKPAVECNIPRNDRRWHQ